MKMKKFWNKAFIAALNRLPAEEAKKEADLAIELCVAHWQTNSDFMVPAQTAKWQDQDVASVPPPKCWPSPESFKGAKK